MPLPRSPRTPAPWRIANKRTALATIVPCDPERFQRGEIIAGGPLSQADAAFIVQACNAHDSLVNALELALATIARLSPPQPYDHTQGTRDVAAAALKLAKPTP